jgi:hypothetical protein
MGNKSPFRREAHLLERCPGLAQNGFAGLPSHVLLNGERKAAVRQFR